MYIECNKIHIFISPWIDLSIATEYYDFKLICIGIWQVIFFHLNILFENAKTEASNPLHGIITLFKIDCHVETFWICNGFGIFYFSKHIPIFISILKQIIFFHGKRKVLMFYAWLQRHLIYAIVPCQMNRVYKYENILWFISS